MRAEEHLLRSKLSLSKLTAVAGTPDFPVAGFPMKFTWQQEWVAIFDKQVDLLKEDIARARVEDRIIVYLSCPISPRGGGFSSTNVEIANHTKRRLMNEFGYRFWFLNPAEYQMESKEGTGLIRRHARDLGISDDELKALPKISGGDYMRMWTRVLVEDDDKQNLGGSFDGYYFLGPSDVRDFLTQGGARSVTAGLEEFFARQFATSAEFRDAYSVPDLVWQPDWSEVGTDEDKERAAQARQDWDDRRRSFFRYYGLRAGTAFSLGSHDEWNIFLTLNDLRLAKAKGDVGGLLAGYFDGRQIDLGAAFVRVSPGYEKS